MKVAFVFILVGFGTKAGFAPHAHLAAGRAQSGADADQRRALRRAAQLRPVRHPPLPPRSRRRARAGLLVAPAARLRAALGRGRAALPARPDDVKRLLAYSSVEHIGLIAVAIGIGGPVGVYAALLHLVNHAITKALLFFLSGELVQRYGTRRIRAIRGVVGATPLLGSLLLIGVLAITGLPPFGMFVSEFEHRRRRVSRGVRGRHRRADRALALIFTGIFGHFGGMVFGAPVKRRLTGADLGRTSMALFGVLALAITVLGLWVPPPLTSAIQQIVRLFTGGDA